MLDINSLNIGFSEEGLREYKNNLQTKIIVDTKAIVDNITEIETVINAGWQGQAKDKFMEDFAASRAKIISDLEREYGDLEARFAQLQNSYFEQDSSMMNS